MWLVYGRYEVQARGEDGEDPYVAAVGKEREEYRPLVDYPGLFLMFARLADDGGEITREAWLEWVHGYGALGLEKNDPTRDLLGRYRELGLGLEGLLDELRWLDDLGRGYGERSGSTEGGPGESYRAFVREARKANRLLGLYEAATAKDDESGRERPDAAFIKRIAEQEGLGRPAGTPSDLKVWALGWLGHVVQEAIAEDCYPALYQTGEKISLGWGFRTLLGAMYLQMAWLQSATEEVRCKWCARVVSYEQPAPPLERIGEKGYRKPYKPRADKEFCGRSCKDRWHYQNVTKPRRLSGG